MLFFFEVRQGRQNDIGLALAEGWCILSGSMSLEASTYFYCDNLPEDSPLRRDGWLQKRERGGLISPSLKTDITPGGALDFSEWADFLRRNRELLRACDTPALEMGIFCSSQVAEFTLHVPQELLRLLSGAGTGLNLLLMSTGNELERYRGQSYFLLSADTPTENPPPGLPPSIIRHQQKAGLSPRRFTSGASLRATDDALMAPGQAEGARTLALCKYLACYSWAGIDVPPVLMRDCSERGMNLLLHLNQPMRRGQRIATTLTDR